MGFGRNPHVIKAQEAALKAEAAADAATGVRAWLEAAHLWERAAAKEQPGKWRAQYEEAAISARAQSEALTGARDVADRAPSRLRLVPVESA